MSKKTVLVTGCFGKIGYPVCKKLLENGYKVFGIDIKAEKLNLTALKTERLTRGPFLKKNLSPSLSKKI